MKKCVVLAAVLLGSAGCATDGDIVAVAESVTSVESSLLSKSEIHDVLIDHTFPFSKGGIYFMTETEATVSWNDAEEDVEWYATDDSSFCYTAEVFGGEEECLGLKKASDGNYIRVFEGNEKVIKSEDIVMGKSF